MGQFEDLTGQKFGKLTAVKRGENTKDNSARWWCQCDCENPNLKLVKANNLKSGKTLSCGCLFIEMLQNRKKYNVYDLSGEYGIGYTSNFNSNGQNEFYFDLEDYDKIKEHCWCFDGHDYVKTTITDSNGKETSLSLHQIILSTKDGYIVDHIHGKESRNNNRKENLRIVTKSQNAMNQAIRNNNTSGVTGVRWHKTAHKWAVEIQKDNKRHYLGLFDNFKDAVQIRKEAEKKYFGEYAYDISQSM